MTTPTGDLTEQRVEAMTDDEAVDVFAASMKAKLAIARTKGRGGWQKACPEALSYMLHEHVVKGDPLDVANFCMFLSLRGLSIAADPATQEIERLTALLGECRIKLTEINIAAWTDRFGRLFNHDCLDGIDNLLTRLGADGVKP